MKESQHNNGKVREYERQHNGETEKIEKKDVDRLIGLDRKGDKGLSVMEEVDTRRVGVCTLRLRE